MSTRAKVALAASGVALAAVPSAAHAVPQIVTQPCTRAVLGQQTVPVQGAGFTPNSLVTLTTAEGGTLGTATADASGAVNAAFDGSPLLPSPSSTKLTTQLTATDAAGLAAPAIPFQMVRVSATFPDRAKPTSRVTFRTTGFLAGKPVYLHVRRAGRTRGSLRIGTPRGDCGTASRRLRYMPLRSYRSGTYEYFFQQSKRFDKDMFALRFRISVVRTVRFR